MADIYQDRVNAVIKTMHEEYETDGDGSEIIEKMKGLESLEIGELLAEIAVQIEESVHNSSIIGFFKIKTTKLPLPENPLAYLKALKRGDLQTLSDLSGGDFSQLLADILMLNAALRY